MRKIKIIKEIEIEVDHAELLSYLNDSELLEEVGQRELETDIFDFPDDEIIENALMRGYELVEVDNTDRRSSKPQNLHEKLCDQFGLPRVATAKDELINHIRSQL